MKILKKHSEINKKPGSQSFINQEKVIKKTTLNGYNTCQNMKSMMMKNLYNGGIAEKLFTHIYQNWQGNSYAFKVPVLIVSRFFLSKHILFNKKKII